MTATAGQLDWTGAMLRELGVQHVLGAHCTGINPVAHLREVTGLDKTTAVVGTVGSMFSPGQGIALVMFRVNQELDRIRNPIWTHGRLLHSRGQKLFFSDILTGRFPVGLPEAYT